MKKRKQVLARCPFCHVRNFGWAHPEGSPNWALYEAQRDASGAVVLNTRDKAAADRSKFHCEPPSRDGSRPGTPCTGATAVVAGSPVSPDLDPDDAEEASATAPPKSAPVVIPDAAPVPVADLGAPKVKPAAKPAVKGPKLPEPEELLSSEALAAWSRYESLLTYSKRPLRVFAWGPPGTGKTELPWIVSQARGWTHVQQQLTEETPGVELTGHLIVQAGSTVWAHGTLGQAIEASQDGPVVYVLDEIGRASADALSAIILAATNPESLRLRLRSGAVISPKPEHWHVVGTSNDDPRMLPEAVRSRFHLAVTLTSPAPGLVRTMVTPEARRMACAAAREHDIRALLSYDRFRADGLSLEEAARLTWEPAVASSVIDAVRLESRSAAAK